MRKNPNHIAFIMDGNGRWATSLGLVRLEGHKKGVETVKAMVEEGLKLGISCMSFYVFSTENWQRPAEEVKGLFNIMRKHFREILPDFHKEGVKVRFIGNRETGGSDEDSPTLAKDIVELMDEVEERTAFNNKMIVQFAINYSGRDDLLRVCKKIAGEVESGKRSVESIKEDTLAARLDTAGIPDPDLVIRTSGEQRISNFMLWQLAYAEFIFHEKRWPDFKAEDLAQCLTEYCGRERRFGKVLT